MFYNIKDIEIILLKKYNKTTVNDIVQIISNIRHNDCFKTLFLEFYNMYPKKQGKGSALRSYDKIIKQNIATHLDIMNGLKKYIKHLDITYNKDDKYKFTKMPSTWLNQECFADEYPENDKNKQIYKLKHFTIADN